MEPDAHAHRISTAGQLLDHASALTRGGDLTGARRRLDEASMILEALPGDDTQERLDLAANVCEGKGQIALMVGRVDEAYFQLSRAIDLRERQRRMGHDGARIAIAVDRLNLAATCKHMGRVDEVMSETRAAVALLEGVEDPGAHGLYVAALQSLGQLSGSAGDHAGAVAHLERAIAATEGLDEETAAALPEGIGAQARLILATTRFASGDVEGALADATAAAEDAWTRLDAQLERAEPIPEGSQGAASLGQYVNAQMNLVSYNEKAERYAEAEDALFRVIQLLGPRPEILDRGRAFYEVLLTLDDARLEAGNLPRDEVEDGLAQIASMEAAPPGGE